MTKYKTVDFDIPKIGKQPLPAITYLPLRFEIRDDYASNNDDVIIRNVIHDIEKFVNRLWKRYHNQELYFNEFELTDSNEAEYIYEIYCPKNRV